MRQMLAGRLLRFAWLVIAHEALQCDMQTALLSQASIDNLQTVAVLAQ